MADPPNLKFYHLEHLAENISSREQYTYIQ